MKTKPVKIICLLLVAVFMLTSCEAVDELTGKGVWGWLEIPNPFNKTEQTPSPLPTTPNESQGTLPQTTVLPTLPPTASQDTPPKTEVIPTYPSYGDFLATVNPWNMGGDNIMVSCPTGSRVLTWQNASMFNDVVASVNKACNVNMFINPQSRDDIFENLSSAAQTGGYSTDLLYLPLPLAMEYAKAGLLAPIDTANLSNVKGVYDSDINSALVLDGKTYALSSSASTAYENNLVIYLNTDMLKRLDIEFDPYSTVNNGQWTWEMIYMLCSAVNEKQNEDSSVCLGGSLWDIDVTKLLLYSSSGMELSKADGEGNEIYDFQKDSYPEFLAQLSMFVNREGFLTGDEAREAFYKGELLMMVGDVFELRQHYHSYDSFAILPLPKADRLQENYVTVVNPYNTYVFAIPKNGENNVKAVYLVDVISYISRYAFKYDFIESLYSVYIRQSGSIPMLGIDSTDRFVPRVLLYGNQELIKKISGGI